MEENYVPNFFFFNSSKLPAREDLNFLFIIRGILVLTKIHIVVILTDKMHSKGQFLLTFKLSWTNALVKYKNEMPEK